MAQRYVNDYQDYNAQTILAGANYADLIVNKNYLIHLDRASVVPFDVLHAQYSALRLYHITKLVYDPLEDSSEKLVSVFNSLGNFGASLFMVVHSTETGVSFYIGISCPADPETAGLILDRSLHGNFPGIRTKLLPTSDVQTLMESVALKDSDSFFNRSSDNDRHVASVSIVPSVRQTAGKAGMQPVQGMEKLIDTMMGDRYTALIIAQPVNKENLQMRKHGLEALFSTLASFESISMTYGQNDSTSVANSLCQNLSNSINHSISNTTGQSSSHTSGYSETDGQSRGSTYQGFFGSSFNTGSSRTYGTNTSDTYGTNTAYGENDGTTDTQGRSDTETTSTTFGENRSFTVTQKNKSIAELLAQIELQLNRIKCSESFGLWEIAAYFVAPDVQTAVVGANAYKALMTGDSSRAENSFVNLWDCSVQQETRDVLRYLQYGQHPRFVVNARAFGIDARTPYIDQQVTAASLVSGHEMPIIMSLPRKSVTGVTVITSAEFGRNVYTAITETKTRQVDLGKVYHMGEVARTPVRLNLHSLASHCFICGSTGSGKSNTAYQMVSELVRNGISFMVVEPAKGEYRKVFAELPNIAIYTTHPLIQQMLRLNPFAFPPQVHVLEHLDRLIEIFSACWPLYAAMPAILKAAFEQSYLRCGWDLSNSLYIANGRNRFPTFADLLETLPTLINESSYSSDSKGDYTGALVTRVSSMTRGIAGQVFCDAFPIPDAKLFDQNVIVDLSRVGSQETKALIMGILVLKLSEYRASTTATENVPLKHVTILEEAHNLLKRSAPSGEGNQLQAKSIEMISGVIAEVRSQGEGFIIIDQSPGAVDVSAIKNTNTKIILRLPEKEDCLVIGKSIGLNEEQIREISRLNTGVAIVHQNNWLEPVQVKINEWDDRYHGDDVTVAYQQLRKLRGQLAAEIVGQLYANTAKPEALAALLAQSGLPECKKAEYAWIRDAYDKMLSCTANRHRDTGDLLRRVLNCDHVFSVHTFTPVSKLPKDATREERQAMSDTLDQLLAALDSYAAFPASKDRLRVFLSIMDSWLNASRTLPKRFLLAQLKYILRTLARELA